MEQVEPLLSDLLEEVYAKFFTLLEAKLVERGAADPRAEALVLLSRGRGGPFFQQRPSLGEGSARCAQEYASVGRLPLRDNVDRSSP